MNDKLKSQMTHDEPPKYLFSEQDDGSINIVKLMPGNNTPRLLPRSYEIQVSMDRPPYLVPIDSAKPPSTIYGDIATDVDRYLRTFQRLEGSMGVAQIGTKGSGKTTTIRTLAQHAMMMDMPVIYVNRSYPKEVLEYVARGVLQDSVWVFEEFDKNFATVNDGGNSDTSFQNALLSIFDDSVVGGKKLYIIAANNPSLISPYLKHRPGRIRYTKYYENLPLATMIGYVKDNLKTNRPMDLVHFVKLRGGYQNLNFDMMAALVDELNHNSKLDVISAVEVMFGDSGSLAPINYIATVTMPDGTVHKTKATEHITYGIGSVVTVAMSSLNDTEVDVYENFTLRESDFVSHSEDVKCLTYTKNGMTVQLRLTFSEIGEKPLISLGSAARDEFFEEDQELTGKLFENGQKRRAAIEAKAERERAEREEKRKEQSVKGGAGKPDSFRTGDPNVLGFQGIGRIANAAPAGVLDGKSHLNAAPAGEGEQTLKLGSRYYSWSGAFPPGEVDITRNNLCAEITIDYKKSYHATDPGAFSNNWKGANGHMNLNTGGDKAPRSGF